MNRLINYLKATKAEVAHVSWPTRQQALVYTALVVAISAIIALFAAGFDYLFSELLNIIITHLF